MKIIAFSKAIIHQGTKTWGRIVIQFSEKSKQKFDFDLTTFIAVSHMLENDEVYYDPVKQVFYSNPEKAHKDDLLAGT